MAFDISELYKAATFQKRKRNGRLSVLEPFYNRPRTCLKRFLQEEDRTPLPAPSFPPKSKVLKLQLEGYRPQTFIGLLHHCSISPCLEKSVFLKPTPKSFPSPTSLRKSSTALQSTSDKDARPQLRDIFMRPDSLQNYFAKSTTRNLWTITLTELQTVWAPGHWRLLGLHTNLESLGLLVPMPATNASRSTALTLTGLSPCLRSP